MSLIEMRSGKTEIKVPQYMQAEMEKRGYKVKQVKQFKTVTKVKEDKEDGKI